MADEPHDQQTEPAFIKLTTGAECNDILRSHLLIPGTYMTNDVVMTETEPWRASVLGLLNGILDTFRPGMRLTLMWSEEDNSFMPVIVLRQEKPEDRPRDVIESLRTLLASVQTLVDCHNATKAESGEPQPAQGGGEGAPAGPYAG